MTATRHLFIGGLHRSGTTMLARLLGEHPEVSGFAGTGVAADEGQHLQSVYPVVSPGHQAGRFALLPDAHLTEDSPLVSDQNRERLLAEWSQHWDTGRAVLVEKSPPNILITRFLQAMVPDARFVVVVRHPIAVSAATQKWSATRPHELLRHWSAAHEVLRGDLPQLRHARIVAYEDLVADPDAVLGAVFAFAGLEDHAPGRTVATGTNPDNFGADRTPRADVNEEYFRSWEGRRRQPVKRIYIDLAERRYARPARAYGYDLRGRSRVAPADPLVARLMTTGAAP